MARGLMIAAPRSGSGKTTVTLALAAALGRRGVRVRVAKSGPDYIDPAFHTAATGAPSPNLDSWAMAPALLDSTLSDACVGAEILLVESAMGLFDGLAGPPGARGAAADLAARCGLPVILVLDVSGQSQSAAAVARGFATHQPGVRVAGVVLNRVSSDRHRDQVRQAMAQVALPVLGSLARKADVALPERHLGLVQPQELEELPALLDRLADLAERHFYLDAIVACAAALPTASARAVALRPPGQRIALAFDAAFSFVYPHVQAGWQRAGAEIVAFSPLADEAPPADCDACWLPGGYPELHAAVLANATRFRDGLARFAATRPVHGECGGYMVLGTGVVDADGTGHAMAGLLSHSTSFASRQLHLGYREARLLADGPLGRAGTRLRGHEFHYATMTDPGRDAKFAEISDGAARKLPLGGGRRALVSGSFFHAIGEMP